MHKYTFDKNTNKMYKIKLLTKLLTLKVKINNYIYILKIKFMAKNQLFGGALILTGAATIYYGLFLDGTKLGKSNDKPSYTPLPTPPAILLNDDRTTFTGPTTTIPPTNGNTVNETPIDNSIKGYPMPNDINNLLPINNSIWVMTKPDISAFNQTGRSMFQVAVNLSNKTLSFIDNIGTVFTEQYNAVKDKLVLPDKKYLR